MSFYRQLGRGLYRATASASRGATNAIADGIDRATLRRGARAAASGVLVPGDPDPPPNGPTDYYDYRGVAIPGELSHLAGQPFTLGRLVDPRRGPRDQIGLPGDILRRHAAVIGPTGGGKTKSILVPWIAAALRLGHCVIAIDIAGDLLDDLARHRQATGPFGAAVAKWDYSDPSHSLSWNWLSALNTDDAIVAAVEAIHGKPPPNDPQPFFHQRDGRILRGLIELVQLACPGSRPSELLRLARDELALSRLISMYASHRAAQRLVDVVGRSAGDYFQVMSGVINDLEVWEHPGLEAVTRTDEIGLTSLLDTGSLLVIGAPIHGGRTSEAASSLILSQVIHQLYRRFTTHSGQHVFLVIDEAARLTSRLRLEELLSVARRARVSIVLATQDVGQFANPDERLALLGNCATYIALPGRSVANAEYLRGRLGQRYQSSTSLTRGRGSMSQGPQQTASAEISSVPVLGDREILNPPWGERSAIVHCQPVSGKPFLVDLTRPEFG